MDPREDSASPPWASVSLSLREEGLSPAELQESCPGTHGTFSLWAASRWPSPHHGHGWGRGSPGVQGRAGGYTGPWREGKGQVPLVLGPLTYRTGRWIQPPRPGVDYR